MTAKSDSLTVAPARPSSLSGVLTFAKYTVWHQRRAPLVWGLSLGALCAMIVAIFPSIQGADGLDKLVESYPRALREAFGVSINTFTTVQGYLTAEVFSLIAPLTLAFFPMRAFARTVSGAEESGALDVLLGTPLSRRQLIFGTFLGTAVSLLGILLVTGVCTWVTALLVGVDLPIADLAAGIFNLWPLSLFFGGIATLSAGFSHHSARVYAVSTFVLVAMYFVDVLGKLSDSIEPLRPVSAFHYYGSAIEQGIDWLSFGGLFAAATTLTVLATYIFDRRDIR